MGNSGNARTAAEAKHRPRQTVKAQIDSILASLLPRPRDIQMSQNRPPEAQGTTVMAVLLCPKSSFLALV
jgi:hypothetical protein